MNPIDQALELAISAHQGITDANGVPTILHSISVGMLGSTDEEKAVGFLHDIAQVTGMTIEDIRDTGLPHGIVAAIEVLTPKPGQSPDDPAHIRDIIDSYNPLAIQVKFNALQGTQGPAYDMISAAVQEMSKVYLHTSTFSPGSQTAIFAAGCFWGVQHAFERLNGVHISLVGYTGGSEEAPSYEDVRAHKTHHVEAVLVEFDPKIVTYTDLCKLFFEIHDPAQVNGVGPDLGPQYRSCIFYHGKRQQQQAQKVIDLLRSLGHEVNTLLLPEQKFWVAERYHQHYYTFTEGEPYCHLRVRKFPRK